VDPEFSIYDLNKAVMVIDLPKSKKSEDELLISLSNIVSQWNTFEYNQINSNCQHFTQELMENGLGVSLENNKESTLIHKVIGQLKINGDYELRKLFSNKDLTVLQHFKSHKDLDIFKIFMEIEGNRDEEITFLLKAFDRAFWFNFKTIEKKIKNLTNLRDKFTDYIQNGFAIRDGIMIERLQITLEVKFLFSLFPEPMEKLKSFKFNLDEKFVEINKIKFELSDALMMVWEKTISHIDKIEIPLLKSEKKKYEPIYGFEAIKRILSKSMSEKEMNKLYLSEDEFPPLEEIKLLGMEFPKNMLENYFNHFCPFKDPTETSSLKKERK
jgi:hypothetical protein